MASATTDEPLPCPGCGIVVDGAEGTTHAYVPTSPGCWAAFTELPAAESARYATSPEHGTVVDTYMAQHPGGDSSAARARRSPVVHLVGLCARIEHGLDEHEVFRLLQRTATALRRDDLVSLEPRLERGAVTVLDPLAAVRGGLDLVSYRALLRRWAQEVWRTWEHEHHRIRALYDATWR